jgi:Domain of unknown function (DUF4349)
MSESGDNNAVIERELAAIDAALAVGLAADDDPRTRELQELALTLREDSPAPDPAFAERLGARVEAGFPPDPGSARAQTQATGSWLRAAPRRAWLIGRQALPAVGVVVAILVPVVLAVSLAGSPDGDLEDGGGGGGVAAPERGAGGGFVPAQTGRRIERSISLDLDVPLDKMAQVAEGVTEATDRHDGFVLSSSVDTGQDSGGGDFSLRIPADRLRPALRDLAQLAPVIRQTQEGRDITKRFLTARDRLQAARAERQSLLRRLADADTDQEAEAIRRRLDLVAGEIHGLRGQLRDVRLRTNYAVVLVSLQAADGGGGVGGSFDDAIGDAGDLLVGTAGVLIRVLALALPLALIGAAAWLASAWLRRRRRESALI